MTNEPPDRAGRPRSDAASRLAALLSEIETSEATDEVGPAESEIVRVAPVSGPSDGPPTQVLPTVAPAAEEEEGAEPPEAEEPAAAEEADEPAAEEPVPPPPPLAPPIPIGRAGLVTPRPVRPAAPGPVVVDGKAPAAPGPTIAGASVASSIAPPAVPASGEAVVPPVDAIADGRGAPPRRRSSKVLAVAFGLTIALLAISVPVLGYVGSQALLDSKGGKVESAETDPRAPGYVAVVDPTPTALVIQRNAAGDPVSLTLLALGNGDDGGSVLFIPLDTNLVRPAFLIDRLRTAYSNGKTTGNNTTFLKQVGRLLNIGFGSVINMKDADWAKVVAPVAPIAIENPVAVEAEGVQFPAGPLQLTAAQVGPYLAATATGQDDLDRLARHKLVWQAWLAAVGSSTEPNPVPTSATSLAPFISTLARGKTGIDTLAVLPAAQPVNGMPTFQLDPLRVRTQLTEAVPAPTSPGLGDRYSVRLLNGVAGNAIPDELVARLVEGGAQINSKGNGPRFGQKVTTIEYHDPNRQGTALLVSRALGAGTVVAKLDSTDTVDLVITLGEDVLDQ